MISRQEFFIKTRREAASDFSTEELYSAYETYSTCPRVAASGYNLSGLSNGRCYRCGNCCRRPWRIEVSLYDILRWIDQRRYDIIYTLEYRPGNKHSTPGRAIIERALKMLGLVIDKLAMVGEEHMASLAFAIYAVTTQEGSMVIPKQKYGCIYHMDGEVSACAIHSTKPEVCVRFPDLTR